MVAKLNLRCARRIKMAKEDALLSKKDFADKNKQELENAYKERDKEKYLNRRGIGSARAYREFRDGGEKNINTEPPLVEKVLTLGQETANSPEYQGAKEMKEAITKERARIDIPKAMKEYTGKKKGGMVKTKKMSSGGTASKRADGCAQRGKTRGKMC